MAWRYTPLSQVDVVLSYARVASRYPWMPLVVSLSYIPACVLMFPQTVITLFAVAAFGVRIGFICAASGVLLAALVMYACGRIAHRYALSHCATPRLVRISAIMRERGILAMFTLRFFPIAPFVVGSMAAGAMHVRLWQYVLGTVLGILPGMIVVVLLGSQIEAVMHASGVNYWMIAATLLVFVAVTVAVRKRLAQANSVSDSGTPVQS